MHKEMDSSSQLDGLIYVPLSDTGVMANNQSYIASWPSFDSPAGFFATSDTASNHQHQQQREFSINFSPQEQDSQLQNAAIPPPSSLFSSSTSALSFLHSSPSTPSTCHPLDPSAAIITSTSIPFDNMDTLNPSSCFNINTNNLSPFYMLPHASMSRSSSISSVSYIDPTTLMLNNTPDPSVVSSCYSTPVSRRLSTFSISGATDSEDDQHRTLQSLFEQNFSVSSPALVPTDDLDPEAFSVVVSSASTTPPVYSQDFLMPDGSMCRFDGTSLVPAPTAHYPNALKDIFDHSPMLSTMPYSGVSFSDSVLSMVIPPHVSLTDYSDLTQDISAPEFAFMATTSQSTGSTTTTTRLPVKKSHSKKCTLKATSLRRNSTDSTYSSSTGSGVKVSGSNSNNKSNNKSNSNNNNNNNNNSNSSYYSKYRKEGAGEFKCPFEGCNYHYNLKRELNRHRNVHVFAGKDKYRCMNCNSGLCRLDSVKRHMEAKGKVECLKKGLYQEFRENGELVRIRKCKPSWYEAAAVNAAAAAAAAGRK